MRRFSSRAPPARAARSHSPVSERWDVLADVANRSSHMRIWRLILKNRGAITTLLAACAGVVALLAPVSASASPGQSASSAPPSSASFPNVVPLPGGWLQYTTTVASQLTLTNASTTTVTGTMESDGSCDIQSAGTAAATSADTFEEVTASNPLTCQDQILTGTLTAGDLTTLSALSTNPNGSADTAAVSDSAAALASASPASTSYQKAYVKTAWIDPLDITITSLADNLKWPLYGAGGTLTARVNPYEFKYDGWSSSGPSKIKFVTLSGNTGWSVNETDHFTNTDFASFVYVVFGVAGWLACGAPLTATAHFNHNVTVYGYRNNRRGWAWKDSKSGACTDLVHHAGWDGFGWAS
jgi:hypothetical protein